MRNNSKGFAPILILVIIVLFIGLGYLEYKNFSVNSWIEYKDPVKHYKFEYPKKWFYEPKGYTISGTWLVVTPGVYPVSKEELEEATKKLDKLSSLQMIAYAEKISDYMPLEYEIVDTKHDFFGSTDVVTSKYCLKAGTIAKGNLPVKGNTICESHSLIDIGGVTTIEVYLNFLDSGNNEETETFKKIISTIRFTD